MQVLHKRQTGESAVPGTLAYGELAVDKAGGVYVGAEDGSVVDQGLPVRRNAKGLSNLSYDVKMLQLQELAEGVSPPMLGGFIEAFRNRNLMNSTASHDVTVDTSAHCCKFDGKEESGEVVGGSGACSSIRDDQTVTVGEFVMAFGQWTQARHLTMTFKCWYKTFLYPNMTDATFTIYGGQTENSCTTELNWGILSRVESEKMLWMTKQNIAPYPYYRIVVKLEGGLGEAEEFLLWSSASSGSFERATAQGSVEYSYTVAGYAPKEGVYQTAAIQLGTPVTGGELYLHHETLPAGATLTPEVQWQGTFLSLTLESERAVTLGGVSVRERRYRLPVQVETQTSVAVRVTGTRANLGDSVKLHDIVFAAF